MKHVLFVLDYFTPHHGGVETVFENVIDRLLKKGYIISVLTSHYDHKLPEIEIHNRLYIYRTGKDRLSFLFFAIKKGISILRKHKIDIIHGSTYGGAIPASILGFLFGKKVILTVHEIFGTLWNVYKGKWKGFWYKVFEKILFLFPYDVYHCVSRYTMNCLRVCYGITDDKLKMIYNGVDYDFWNPDKVTDKEIKKLRNDHDREGKFLVLYYGHAGKSKGIDYLVQAIPGILSLDKDIVMIFNLIESKRTPLIKKEILKLKFNPQFKDFESRIYVFNGFSKQDLRHLVASVDCIVAPSLSEGFGSVHSEVCAMKKPLITTYVASLPEVVSNQAIMISPASSWEIVQAIKKVKQIKDNKKSSLLTFEQLSNFDWDKTVEEIEKLYY